MKPFISTLSNKTGQDFNYLDTVKLVCKLDHLKMEIFPFKKL
jgi:hypothetical protein